jgi:hypothetical protein
MASCSMMTCRCWARDVLFRSTGAPMLTYASLYSLNNVGPEGDFSRLLLTLSNASSLALIIGTLSNPNTCSIVFSSPQWGHPEMGASRYVAIEFL